MCADVLEHIANGLHVKSGGVNRVGKCLEVARRAAPFRWFILHIMGEDDHPAARVFELFQIVQAFCGAAAIRLNAICFQQRNVCFTLIDAARYAAQPRKVR